VGIVSLLLSSGKRELVLDPAFMNSAGMLGFGPEARGVVALEKLGAFVTAPVSLEARSPARGPRSVDTAGGMLLHTGLPNPGLKAVLRKHAAGWNSFPGALILHLLVSEPFEIAEAARLLEDDERIEGVELGLEIASPEQARLLLEHAAQLQRPCIARLPLDCPQEVILAARDGGAQAIGLGPPRGRAQAAGGEFVSGRLYGPALLPLLLERLRTLRPLLDCPLLAGAGLFDAGAFQAAFNCGADALQLDSVLWLRPEILQAELLRPAE